MTTSDARKRNAETAQDPHAFTREWLRWVDESQHFTPAHPLNLTPTDQEPDMTDQTTSAKLDSIYDEQVEQTATLHAIRDLLNERLPDRQKIVTLGLGNLEAFKHEIETPMREHGECCEPGEVTEEPPVGSQVTDKDDDVWERREAGWALWWPERSGWIADLYEGEADPWPVVRDQAPLRFTTDEDRERVGLPVDTAPDGDPDEALARLIYGADRDSTGEWDELPDDVQDDFRRMARAAREHIRPRSRPASVPSWGGVTRHDT